MESKLNLLQRRRTGAKNVALCPAMDLVALLTEDGQLSVHRTLSWERIVYKGVEDIDDEWGMPTALTFSPSGNLLALGHQSGQVSIVNLESGAITKAYDWSKLLLNNSSEIEQGRIVRVDWVLRPAPEHDEVFRSNVSVEEVRLAGLSGISNVYQGLKASAVNAADISLDTDNLFSISESAMPGSILYATIDTGVVLAYVAGLFPLFATLSHSSGGMPPLPASSTHHLPSLAPLYSFAVRQQVSARAAPLCGRLWGTEKILFGQGQHSLHTFLASLHEEDIVLQLIRMKSSATLLNRLLGTCAKRWKDANRPLSAKVGLLKSVLDGYQLNMTPLQFLYSIALCGLWHPAAVASFSQHWNDQGLNRLRSGVDAASKSILQTLHFDVTNVATTLTCQCLELSKILHIREESFRQRNGNGNGNGGGDNGGGDKGELLQEVQRLLAAGEATLLKVDDAVKEARKARDRVLLLIKFVREAHYEATVVSEGDKEKEKEEEQDAPKQVSSAPKPYLQLFDIRKERVPPLDPALVSEHLVGSHLLAYFMEKNLPQPLLSSSTGGAGFPIEETKAETTSSTSSDSAQAQIQLQLQLQLKALRGPVSGDPEVAKINEEYISKSLVQAFRCLEERVDLVLTTATTIHTRSMKRQQQQQQQQQEQEQEQEQEHDHELASNRVLSMVDCAGAVYQDSVHLSTVQYDPTNGSTFHGKGTTTSGIGDMSEYPEAAAAAAGIALLLEEEQGQIIEDEADMASISALYSTLAVFARESLDASSGWELVLFSCPDEGQEELGQGQGLLCAIVEPSVAVNGEPLQLQAIQTKSSSSSASASSSSSSSIVARLEYKFDAAEGSHALSLYCLARASSGVLRSGGGGGSATTPKLGRGDSTATASSSMKSFFGDNTASGKWAAGDGGDDDRSNELLLFKVPLDGVQWTRVPSLPVPSVTPARQVVECRAGRALAMQSLSSVAMSPDRNVAAVLDEGGKLVIIDLEEEE